MYDPGQKIRHLSFREIANDRGFSPIIKRNSCILDIFFTECITVSVVGNLTIISPPDLVSASDWGRKRLNTFMVHSDGSGCCCCVFSAIVYHVEITNRRRIKGVLWVKFKSYIGIIHYIAFQILSRFGFHSPKILHKKARLSFSKNPSFLCKSILLYSLK